MKDFTSRCWDQRQSILNTFLFERAFLRGKEQGYTQGPTGDYRVRMEWVWIEEVGNLSKYVMAERCISALEMSGK